MEECTVPVKKKQNKWCIVPMCTSTSISTPGKLFVNVPINVKRRKAWIKAVKRDERVKPVSLTSTLFCCEDHFNMEEDMENFMKFKMMGGILQCKKDTLPHIFKCQQQRTGSTSAPKPREAVKKRNTLRILSEAMASNQPGRVDCEENTQSQAPPMCLEPNDELDIEVPIYPLTRDVGVQARSRVGYRSRGTTCHPSELGYLVSKQTSPIKKTTCDAQSSPIKKLPVKRQRLRVEEIFTDSSCDEECELEIATFSSGRIATGSPESASALFDSTTDSDSSSDEIEKTLKLKRIQESSLERTRFLRREQSMRYTGVPYESTFIVELLAKQFIYRGSFLHAEDVVLLILRKVRLNESFAVIGDEFGISTSHASRLFADYVSIIARNLKELIVWPEKETIHRRLPLAFRARYSNVQSIIDCFEIEIEKPTKAVNQALTWSDYKKCNTLKYLISATPDGIVNYVSRGYGGRVSDMVLLEDSGFLEKLPEGIEVMADRGFKHVEKAVQEKNCMLVRPPSVSEGTKMSPGQCKETKRIASLRIHIERLIRRVREFKMLTPHACLDIHMLGRVDSCVEIAVGLINLQSSLIK